MTMNKKHKVVVADANHDLLAKVLERAGYEVVQAKSEDEIVRSARKNPSLIIGDFKTDSIDVPKFCGRIKGDYLLRHTPIIVVTSQGEIREKIEAVNGGADDYIVSPFLNEELLARVNRVIHATENALNANPLTKLPGNISLKHEIQERIDMQKDFAAYYLDIDHFKVFNDCYGYERGDKAITFTSHVILESLSEIDIHREDDFVGHIGGDDFVVLTHPGKAELLCKEIIGKFDRGVITLYDEMDREKKFIVGRDRKGKTNFYSFITISIAVVVSQGEKSFQHLAEVSQSGAEIKKYLKQFNRSIFMVDRRI